MIRSSCNSHYVSHFAAFFIVAGTKRSTVKRLWILCFAKPQGWSPLVVVMSNFWVSGRRVGKPHPIVGEETETNHLGFLIARPAPKGRSSSLGCCVCFFHVNDPSAGSPTETLLRLLLPLNEQICTILAASSTRKLHLQPPKDSSIHPIGRSDGRCVQRAGT